MERERHGGTSGAPRPIDACAAARLTLSAGIDGESAELEQEAALRHAAGCQAFAAESEQLSATLRAAAVLSPSQPLAPDIQRRRIPRSVAAGGSVVAVLAAAVLGALVSARVQQAPSRPPAAELRIANLDSRQAQLRFQQRQVQALLHLPDFDPTIDRALQRQRLG